MNIESKDISVIVQGPVSDKFTPQCLKSIRKYLPDAEIIFSTWEGTDVSGLDYDVLLLNEDPGSVIIDNSNKMYNVNRQMISTLNGLRKSSRKYSVKFRTDMIFKGNSFLEYFGRYEKRCEGLNILKNRVLVPDFELASESPYFVSDQFFFGLTEDLINIWDIQQADEKEITEWFYYHIPPQNDRMTLSKIRYAPEQYIWLNFLKKYKEINFEHRSNVTPENIYLTELSIANNLIVIPFERLNIFWLKAPSNKTSDVNYVRWLKLYGKYCDNNFIMPEWCDIYEKFDLALAKLKYHFGHILNPIKAVLKWVLRFISVISYAYRAVFLMIKLKIKHRNN